MERDRQKHTQREIKTERDWERQKQRETEKFLHTNNNKPLKAWLPCKKMRHNQPKKNNNLYTSFIKFKIKQKSSVLPRSRAWLSSVTPPWHV